MYHVYVHTCVCIYIYIYIYTYITARARIGAFLRGEVIIAEDHLVVGIVVVLLGSGTVTRGHGARSGPRRVPPDLVAFR